MADDSIPPEQVSEVEVENLPGGARISYKVPSDEDALMVEANYTRNDQEVTVKSSIYSNFVVIEGLREATSQEVQLVSVDKSNNRSQPVTVSIDPLTAPVDKLFSSLELVEDFGGVRLFYNNEDEIPAELLLYAEDESGNLVYSQSAFITDSSNTSHTFRGYPPESTRFGVTVIDRWENHTDTLDAELVPMLEVQLDRNNFDDVVLAGDEPSAWGWVKNNMWNGSINGAGFHTAQGQPGAVIPPYTEAYHMFTMDLGVTAKLSRFKFFQRQGGWAFRHGNPRYFEVWGTDELPADNGESLEGWTRLITDGESIKPSGAPLGTLSAEDQAAAAAGDEFEFPIEAPPVRYIRFVNFESWSGGKFMHILELEFYGQPQE